MLTSSSDREHCDRVSGRTRFTLLLPVWTALALVLSLVDPGLFTWLRGPLITVALGLIMLGMGLGLEPRDFRDVFRHPRAMVIRCGRPASGDAVARSTESPGG